ncbi:MAG: hypothetical protein K2L19_01850 [Eubacterium sp.]|nr:hypothetical protein [Eubacterium sp.]
MKRQCINCKHLRKDWQHNPCKKCCNAGMKRPNFEEKDVKNEQNDT